jgi:hypothetical protein
MHGSLRAALRQAVVWEGIPENPAIVKLPRRKARKAPLVLSLLDITRTCFEAAEGMPLMINDGIPRRDPVLFCGLLERFLLDQKQEQEAEQITHNTLASYRSMTCQHIRPSVVTPAPKMFGPR